MKIIFAFENRKQYQDTLNYQQVFIDRDKEDYDLCIHKERYEEIMYCSQNIIPHEIYIINEYKSIVKPNGFYRGGIGKNVKQFDHDNVLLWPLHYGQLLKRFYAIDSSNSG